jgi:hypothetical protein
MMPQFPSKGSAYEADFYEWTQCAAELLRQGRFSEVDRQHVAEEIGDMGRRTNAKSDPESSFSSCIS